MVVVGERPVIIALAVVGVATAIVSESRFGIELDCLIVLRDRPIVVTLAIVGRAAAVVGKSKVRIEPYRTIEVGNRRS